MNMLKYTNGVGHLIMSILIFSGGLVCILWPGADASLKGIGVGMLITVQSAWFVPGAAKQVAQEVVQSVGENNATK